MARKPWCVTFLATPESVAELRRLTRTQLGLWGLHDTAATAELCVSELASNVITHVGTGTRTTLALRMNGTHLRIEMLDTSTDALPALTQAQPDAEAGRGVALVDALADRWGVLLHADGKTTWCDLAAGLTSPNGHKADVRVDRVESLVRLYRAERIAWGDSATPLSIHAAEESAIELISDVLHWLRAHGHDPDESLDCAQTRFEVTAGLVRNEWPS